MSTVWMTQEPLYCWMLALYTTKGPVFFFAQENKQDVKRGNMYTVFLKGEAWNLFRNEAIIEKIGHEPHTSIGVGFTFVWGLVIGPTPSKRRKSKALTLVDQLSSRASNGRYATQAYTMYRAIWEF